jgi:hypothetical protein
MYINRALAEGQAWYSNNDDRSYEVKLSNFRLTISPKSKNISV